MRYERIKNITATVKTASFSRKRQHVFACAILCLFTISIFNLSSTSYFGLETYIHKITSKWATQDEDFGKIKFVNFDANKQQESGVFLVASPFKNYYATNISNTKLCVYGLGDPIVLSPIDGIIKNIVQNNNQYFVEICYEDIVIKIENIDFVCVKLQEKVTKKQKIAISQKSMIGFEMWFKNSAVELPAAGANDAFFE